VFVGVPDYMPVLQFKGKSAIECFYQMVPHHTLEFDAKRSAPGKGETARLDANLILEGERLISLMQTVPVTLSFSRRVSEDLDRSQKAGESRPVDRKFESAYMLSGVIKSLSN